MGVLTSDQIFGVDDLKKETVPCPEWGGEIIVREPTAAEYDAYEQSLVRTKVVGKKTEVEGNFANSKARLVVRCVVTETGERVFTDEDADKLGKKSATVIGHIFDTIQRLSGKGPGAKEKIEQD